MSEQILVVEDDMGVRTTIVTFLEMEGFRVEAVSSTRDALDRLSKSPFPLVISDIYIDDRTGIDVLMAAKRQDPDCSVILMTARGTMETVMAATRNGAFDYLAKPFELDTLLEAVKRAINARKPEDDEVEPEEIPESEMIGSSAGMVEIYKTVSRVAPTDATVIIEGETGTGKELIARMIHRFSSRVAHPFVPVDCGAIPAALLESELFGAMRGAFTGADRDRIGVFESAHRGTVFLDEIGEIDTAFQVKLLRFLQEREIRPVGSAREKKVDVRVVAATNRNLQKMVEDGKFREDLWHRMNVVRLTMPPLRERRNDVPLLAHFFVNKYGGRYQQDVKLTESGLRALKDFTWPGNVRQLQHLIERMTILAPNGRIDAEAVHDSICAMEPRDGGGETLAETEADQIRRVLAATGGKQKQGGFHPGNRAQDPLPQAGTNEIVELLESLRMQRFRIGAITDEFSPDIATAASAMNKLSMTGAELRLVGGKNVMDLSNAEITEIVATLRANGLQVISIASPLLKCTLPDAPEIDSRFQQDIFASKHTFHDQAALAERAFEIAKRTGANIVRVFSYWRVVEPDAVFERVVDALQELSDKAARHGLIIGLENEHACNIATAQDTARVLAAVDHENLQVVWDPANAYVSGENPYPSGYRLLDVSRIAHVHAKDCTLEGHKAIWCPLGEGDVDWEGQIDAMAGDGYRGFVHLETHWAGPGGDKLEGSRICGRNLKKLVQATAF